jgi:hypothetical protein
MHAKRKQQEAMVADARLWQVMIAPLMFVR